MNVKANRGSDRWLFLIGGVAAIVGTLIGIVGNLIHPDTPSGDPAGVARAIAESETWLPIHLAIVLGIVLMFGGLVALAYSVRGDLAVALGRLGLAAAIAGVAVGLVLVILDAVAARQRIGAGLVRADAGESVLASRVLTIIGPTVITLWLFVMGILLVRKGQRLAATSSAGRLPMAAESVT